MNRFISTIALASALVVPVASFAGAPEDSVTRSEVRAQVAEAQQNGTLHQSKVHYPSEQASTQAARTVDTTSYGTSMAGSSQSREVALNARQNTLFLHH
jgi:Domain of unknown function (DUF4148)